MSKDSEFILDKENFEKSVLYYLKKENANYLLFCFLRVNIL